MTFTMLHALCTSPSAYSFAASSALSSAFCAAVTNSVKYGLRSVSSVIGESYVAGPQRGNSSDLRGFVDQNPKSKPSAHAHYWFDGTR